MKMQINPAELVRIVHPGELKELREEKASVYVPGWKSTKPAEIVSGWKLETICKLIEEGRLFYYPADPEARQTVARLAPEDRELDKLPLAIMKLVDEDLKKIKEKGVEIVSHTWTPEPVIEVRTAKGIETIRGPIAEGTTIKASKDGVEIIAPAGNPEIEIDGPEPHPEIVPAPEARKTCSEGCSPSDYWAGGKCARVGCFVADPPIDPDEALEAQRRLNDLKRKAEQREKELEKEGTLEKIDVLVVIVSVLAIAAAIIGGALL